MRSIEVYFRNCKPAQVSPLAMDRTVAKRLWTLSMEAVGLD